MGDAGGPFLEALGALLVLVGLFFGLAVVLEEFCDEGSFLFGLVLFGPFEDEGVDPVEVFLVECECLPLCVAHVWVYLSVVVKGIMKDGYLPGELC